MSHAERLRVALVGPVVHVADDDVLRSPGVEILPVPVAMSTTPRSRAARVLRELVAPTLVAVRVHRDPARRRVIRTADVVVATVPDAVLAVRAAGTRNRRAALVNGLPAARRHVVRRVSAGAS